MDSRIEAAVRVPESEYQKSLRVTEIGRRVGLSRSHLAFLFKQETGLTMKTCLRIVRVKRAAELLRQDHAGVKQIALSVGYRHGPIDYEWVSDRMIAVACVKTPFPLAADVMTLDPSTGRTLYGYNMSVAGAQRRGGRVLARGGNR